MQIEICNNGKTMMTSREISELVESRHDKVKQSIDRLVAKGIIESPPSGNFKNINNVDGTEYIFTGEQGKRDSIIVVAQLSPLFTARLVDRWQELEAKIVTAPPLTPQMQLANAVLLAQTIIAEKDSQIEQRDKLIAIAAPKAAALHLISLADGSLCITDAAKTLGIQPKKVLIPYLKANKWIYHRPGCDHPIAYQDKLQQMLLEHKVTTVSRTDGSEKITEQVRVTPKGLTRLAEIFGTEGK